VLRKSQLPQGRREGFIDGQNRPVSVVVPQRFSVVPQLRRETQHRNSKMPAIVRQMISSGGQLRRVFVHQKNPSDEHITTER